MSLEYFYWDGSIEVMMGQVVIAEVGNTLHSGPLGSCIGVVIYDIAYRKGGMAHVMLPGESSFLKSEARYNYKYAGDALTHLIHNLVSESGNSQKLRACVAGAGNVLKKEDDRICQQNIDSVLGILSNYEIPVVAKDLGGTMRRLINIEIDTGVVTLSKGEGGYQRMYQF